MVRFRLDIRGTAPLIMHSSRLADALDPATKALKEISAKRKKTDDDLAQLSLTEWLGGLYYDPALKTIYMPSDNVQACLIEAAKATRKGKTVDRAIFLDGDVNPLDFPDKNKTIEALSKDENYVFRKVVTVMRAKVVRTRPIFREWSTSVFGVLDTSEMNWQDFVGIVERAGSFVGLGDWRPRYGRFEATVTQIKK